MPLTKPNATAAPLSPAQATLYQSDLDALVQGIAGDGVLSGCGVSPQSPPDGTVVVAAGTVRIGGVAVVVAGGTVALPAADATNPRWVLISVDATGDLTATAGAAAAVTTSSAPLLPAIPADSVALAAVWWPAVATAATANHLSDMRVIVPAGDADTLGGQAGSYYLSRTNHTGTQAISTVAGLQDALDGEAAARVAGDGALDARVDALEVAPPAHTQAWATITGTPTTLAGYGITDAASDAELSAHADDTTGVHGIADTAALYRSGGTDVAVADGGTGASNATDARANLGLGTAATAAATDFVSATATRSANTVLAGPTSGGAAAPTFRALTAADVPLGGGQLAHRRVSVGGDTPWMLPGVVPVGTTTNALGSGSIRYYPIRVRSTITAVALGLEVTTAGSGGSTARMGIYTVAGDWMPDALVIDAGTVAVDSTGVKTATISQSLAPGDYLLAFNCSANITVRVVTGNIVDGWLTAAGGTSMVAGYLRVVSAYAAFASSAVAPTELTGAGQSGIPYPVWLRI